MGIFLTFCSFLRNNGEKLSSKHGKTSREEDILLSGCGFLFSGVESRIFPLFGINGELKAHYEPLLDSYSPLLHCYSRSQPPQPRLFPLCNGTFLLKKVIIRR